MYNRDESFYHHGSVEPRRDRFIDFIGWHPCDRRQFHLYDIETDYLLLTETRHQALVMRNGEALKEGSSYNDFYGMGSSFSGAHEDAVAFVDHYPEFEVIIQATVEQQRAFKTREESAYGADKYLRIPARWIMNSNHESVAAWLTRDEFDGPSLQRTDIPDIERQVWSSLAPDDFSLMLAMADEYQYGEKARAWLRDRETETA